MHELPFHSSPLNTSLTEDLNRSGVSDDSGEELPTAWYRTQIKDYYKNNLSIGHLNINSIFSKIDEVIDILNECHFNILFLSETKLDKSVSSTFYLTHIIASFTATESEVLVVFSSISVIQLLLDMKPKL